MALKNLRRMAKLGWTGDYGFYEAVDYRRRAGNHPFVDGSSQGMSLLAACNLLHNNSIQGYFHSEPQVLATELSLTSGCRAQSRLRRRRLSRHRLLRRLPLN